MRRRQSQPNPVVAVTLAADCHHRQPKSPARAASTLSSSSTPLPLNLPPEERRPSSASSATELSSPTSAAELERELRSMSTQLQQAESRISRLKSANRMSMAADSADDVCKRASENVVKSQMQDLSMSKTRLEQTCDELRQQRDQLAKQIADMVAHPSDEIRPEVWEKVLLPFQTQLASVRRDIQDAQAEYERLDQARNEVMNDMVLLNTKNAELNTLNNELSRRMTQREREAVAFMAGTNFLDTAGKKHSTEIASTEEDTVPRLRRLKNKRMMFFGKSSSSSTLSSSSPRQRKGSSSSSSAGDDQPQQQAQPHKFVQSKFLRPVRCDVCGEKVWRATEFKCQACSAVCHTKCAPTISSCPESQNSSVPPPLPPKQQQGRAVSMVFGNDLATQIHLEDRRVPVIVEKCVEAVESRGMDCEGIYRRSGGAGQTRQIQQLFDQGQVPDLSDKCRWNDISAITSVLKLYFRNLPDPLFTFAAHDAFIHAIRNKDPTQRLAAFRHLLHKALPPENYNTLRYIIQHLVRVQEQHQVNLMNTRNLAVVFGPTLLRNPDENEDLLEMNRKIEIIDYMIRNEHELFADGYEQQQQQQQQHQPQQQANPETSSGSSSIDDDDDDKAGPHSLAL